MMAGVIRRHSGGTTRLRDLLADHRLKSSYAPLAVAGVVAYFLMLIRTVAQTATAL
jgi:hypothetical protein